MSLCRGKDHPPLPSSCTFRPVDFEQSVTRVASHPTAPAEATGRHQPLMSLIWAAHRVPMSSTQPNFVFQSPTAAPAAGGGRSPHECRPAARPAVREGCRAVAVTSAPLVVTRGSAQLGARHSCALRLVRRCGEQCCGETSRNW